MTTQELVFKSPSISIDVAKGPSASDLECAFALFFAFKKLKKGVSIFGDISQFSIISDNKTKEKTVAVTLRGISNIVSKIYYERDNKDLRLYFSLKKGGFSEKDLAVETKPSSDLTLIVGENHSEYNHPKVTKTLINSVLEMLNKDDRNQILLLSRILSKAEYKQNQKLCVCSIDDSWFSETHTSPKQLAPIIEELRVNSNGSFSYLLLFQEQNFGKGLLWSEDIDLKKKFDSISEKQERGPWMILRGANIKELKEKIQSIL